MAVAEWRVHLSSPDRRLMYGADGSARLEVDPKGDGHFVAVNEPKRARARRASEPVKKSDGASLFGFQYCRQMPNRALQVSRRAR